MEQAAYMIGVILSGFIFGSSMWAARSEPIDKRRDKLKKQVAMPTPLVSDQSDIIVASLNATQQSITIQESMWHRIEDLEKAQEAQNKIMDDLRQTVQNQEEKLQTQEAQISEITADNAAKDRKIEDQQSEIDLLARKVKVLREQLKDAGIILSDEELEELL